VWTAPTLTSGLLVLAALFVRATVTALALTALATLLALILIIVCHFDSSPFVD
jgi:hypothetical protein